MEFSKPPKAWQSIISFPISGRLEKPRQNGLTMIIDKGIGLSETKEMLEIASDYIDFLKLGFGTSAFYNETILKEKINIAKSFKVEVYPGGTFLEVAIIQGKLKEYLDRAKELGFLTIEISDGTITMSKETRSRAIEQALSRGFKVITEVGKKDPKEKISPSQLVEQVAFDISLGAYKVIVEGRETGKGIGFYDQNGKIDQDEFEEVLAGLPDSDSIIWEAPLKNQQVELIQHLGPNVNFGNIKAEEILSLEALRVGLRADTLKSCLLQSEKVVTLFQRDSIARIIS